MTDNVLATMSRGYKLKAGPIPLYYQLEHELRERIESDEFSVGGVLPTEDQICAQYGVSRITVRRALDALLMQGLIVRRRGVGSFVAERNAGMKSRLTGSLNEFLSSAASLRTTALSLGPQSPPASVRKAFDLHRDEDAILLKLVSSLDEEGPVGYLEMWFPLEVGSRLRTSDVEGKTPIIRVVERKLGVRVVRAEQLIEPDRAGREAGRYLNIPEKTPILSVRRVYYTAAERPIEIAYVRYHPQRYRYQIEFKSY